MNAITFDYAALDAETRIVVQQKTGEIHERIGSIKRDFIEIGNRLTDVKARLPYGYWGVWLESEFGWSQDTATNLMNAAHLAGKIPKFSESGGQFAQTAMYVLGAKTTPSEAVKEAVDRAEHGERITLPVAKQIINSHRSGVRADGDGAEPDLDEDGQPLRRWYEDAEDEEDLRVGDVVQYGGQRYTLRSVASSGRVYFDVPKSNKLFGRGIESEDVALLERAAEMRRPPVQPGPTAEETAPHIDGVSIATSHPAGWKLLFLEAAKAECLNCGAKSARWSPVRGSDWRCEACKRLTHDDLLIAATDAPPPRATAAIPVVDEMPINESHPVGFEGLYATPEAIGYGRATCASCHETTNRWTPVRAGRWRCDVCRATVNDDAMQISGKAEYDLENRVKRSGHSNGHKPAADPVANAPAPRQNAVHYSSQSVEWYTPPEIIDRVREVMPINLDPASCYAAQQVIRADAYFDAQMNGLHPLRRWDGHVFLNPEYGSNIGKWVERLIAEYCAAHTIEAILLVPARVDTEWYRLLRDYPRCHVNGRVQFWNEQAPLTDKDRAGAPFPSAIFYLGNRVDAFAEAFSPIGDIYTLWRPQS